MKKYIILIAILSVLPGLAAAEVFQLKPGLQVSLPDLKSPWSASTEPNASLVEHLAEHVVEEAAAEGKVLTAEQAEQVARKRAAGNQLFVSNSKSGAHLLISFSALKEGEAAPSAQTVARSAKYAVDSALDEGWQVDKVSHAVTEIKGARYARWFSIEYTHEGEPGLFMGIVGFADPYWFWLYGNDHLQDPADRKKLEMLMLGIEIGVGS